jgi:thioredoxin reductase
MKYLVPILVIFLSITVYAQSKQERQALANSKLLEQTVFGTKDSLTLEKLFAKKATYIHSSGKVETREEAISNIVKNKSVYTRSDTLISYNTEKFKDSTIVKHLFIAKEKKADGTEGTLRLHLTLTWVKEKGDWKLLRRVAKRA